MEVNTIFQGPITALTVMTKIQGLYEFLGCVFHGCKICYPHDRSKTNHPTTDQSIEELYVITKKREKEIKNLNYKYKCIWEHQFHKNLKKKKDMNHFVSQLDIQDRLNPRDSFFWWENKCGEVTPQSR